MTTPPPSFDALPHRYRSSLQANATEDNAFRLLALPPDLRIQIYKLVVIQPRATTPRSTSRWKEDHLDRTANGNFLARQPALLRVSKQIRNEALAIFYARNYFRLNINCLFRDGMAQISMWLHSLCDAALWNLRYLQLGNADAEYVLVDPRVDGLLRYADGAIDDAYGEPVRSVDMDAMTRKMKRFRLGDEDEVRVFFPSEESSRAIGRYVGERRDAHGDGQLVDHGLHHGWSAQDLMDLVLDACEENRLDARGRVKRER